MPIATVRSTLRAPIQPIVILSLLMVFLCGAVAGAMTMSYLLHPNLHNNSRPSAAGMSMSLKEWNEQLDLSEEQTRQLKSVLDDFSHYYDNLLADGNSRVLQILTAEQKRRYEQMLRDHKILMAK